MCVSTLETTLMNCLLIHQLPCHTIYSQRMLTIINQNHTHEGAISVHDDDRDDLDEEFCPVQKYPEETVQMEIRFIEKKIEKLDSF